MGKRYIEAEKARYQRNKQKICEYNRAWAKNNKDKRSIARRRRYAYLKSINGLPVYKRNYSDSYKKLVLAHYGQNCICCGEDNTKLLTIDHIENNGKEHGTAKYRYKGIYLYRYLVKNNYPNGLRILCFNCNIGRKNNRGICPHKE